MGIVEVVSAQELASMKINVSELNCNISNIINWNKFTNGDVLNINFERQKAISSDNEAMSSTIYKWNCNTCRRIVAT